MNLHKFLSAAIGFIATAASSFAMDEAVSGTNVWRVPGTYFVTWDSKQAVFPQKTIITAGMREHINRARWSKGQHKLPSILKGWEFDLNQDGVFEAIIETGEWGGKKLILQIQGGRAEIIGSFEGPFGLIRREQDWDDFVVIGSSDSDQLTRSMLRFDGKRYSRI